MDGLGQRQIVHNAPKLADIAVEQFARALEPDKSGVMETCFSGNSGVTRMKSHHSLALGRLFIRTHNETLSVAPMRVNNPDRPPLRIHG
jgi:hypothetical protein